MTFRLALRSFSARGRLNCAASSLSARSYVTDMTKNHTSLTVQPDGWCWFSTSMVRDFSSNTKAVVVAFTTPRLASTSHSPALRCLRTEALACCPTGRFEFVLLDPTVYPDVVDMYIMYSCRGGDDELRGGFARSELQRVGGEASSEASSPSPRFQDFVGMPALGRGRLYSAGDCWLRNLNKDPSYKTTAAEDEAVGGAGGTPKGTCRTACGTNTNAASAIIGDPSRLLVCLCLSDFTPFADFCLQSETGERCSQLSLLKLSDMFTVTGDTAARRAYIRYATHNTLVAGGIVEGRTVVKNHYDGVLQTVVSRHFLSSILQQYKPTFLSRGTTRSHDRRSRYHTVSLLRYSIVVRLWAFYTAVKDKDAAGTAMDCAKELTAFLTTVAANGASRIQPSVSGRAWAGSMLLSSCASFLNAVVVGGAIAGNHRASAAVATECAEYVEKHVVHGGQESTGSTNHDPECNVCKCSIGETAEWIVALRRLRALTGSSQLQSVELAVRRRLQSALRDRTVDPPTQSTPIRPPSQLPLGDYIQLICALLTIGQLDGCEASIGRAIQLFCEMDATYYCPVRQRYMLCGSLPAGIGTTPTIFDGVARAADGMHADLGKLADHLITLSIFDHVIARARICATTPPSQQSQATKENPFEHRLHRLLASQFTPLSKSPCTVISIVASLVSLHTPRVVVLYPSIPLADTEVASAVRLLLGIKATSAYLPAFTTVPATAVHLLRHEYRSVIEPQTMEQLRSASCIVVIDAAHEGKSGLGTCVVHDTRGLYCALPHWVKAPAEES